MKNENQGNGQGHFVDFIIAFLSGGLLLVGIVMVIVSWRGLEGPSLSSVLLLLAGAVLFAGHNVCLYLEDCANDLVDGLAEIRNAIDRSEPKDTPRENEKPEKNLVSHHEQ